MAEAEAFALFTCHPNAREQLQEPTMAAGENLQMACPSGAVIYIYNINYMSDPFLKVGLVDTLD
jgi:hypothetical protein